jgi:hypothetical protein
MQLKTQGPEPRGDGGPQPAGLLLAVAVRDDVIRLCRLRGAAGTAARRRRAGRWRGPLAPEELSAGWRLFFERLLVFARPELGQARPGFGTGRNRSTLTLDPLDLTSMDQLVDALVPGMPAAARATITGQAQGIPLFAAETVRALIDRDIARPAEGGTG